MALTPIEQRHLLAHLNRTWKTNVCPYCQNNDWLTHGVFYLPLSHTGHEVEGRALPSAALVCKTCGNTVLINLMIAGVVNLEGHSTLK